MKMRYPVLLLSLAALWSGSVLAATMDIPKTARPTTVVISQGTGLSYFGILHADLPKGVAYPKLTGIDWKTTTYPGVVSDTVEICYYRPYQSGYVSCQNIKSGSTSSQPITDWNREAFGDGASVQIHHKINSTTKPNNPAGQDTVIFHISY